MGRSTSKRVTRTYSGWVSEKGLQPQLRDSRRMYLGFVSEGRVRLFVHAVVAGELGLGA